MYITYLGKNIAKMKRSRVYEAFSLPLSFGFRLLAVEAGGGGSLSCGGVLEAFLFFL